MSDQVGLPLDGGCPYCGCRGPEDHQAVPMVAARPDDPDTSRAAEDAVRVREGGDLTKVRRGTHRHRMLTAYAPVGGVCPPLTDREAAKLVGLDGPGVCYWKRASELRQVGFITPTGLTVLDEQSGAQRELCAITAAGRSKITEVGLWVGMVSA